MRRLRLRLRLPERVGIEKGGGELTVERLHSLTCLMRSTCHSGTDLQLTDETPGGQGEQEQPTSRALIDLRRPASVTPAQAHTTPHSLLEAYSYTPAGEGLKDK